MNGNKRKVLTCYKMSKDVPAMNDFATQVSELIAKIQNADKPALSVDELERLIYENIKNGKYSDSKNLLKATTANIVFDDKEFGAKLIENVESAVKILEENNKFDWRW